MVKPRGDSWSFCYKIAQITFPYFFVNTSCQTWSDLFNTVQKSNFPLVRYCQSPNNGWDVIIFLQREQKIKYKYITCIQWFLKNWHIFLITEYFPKSGVCFSYLFFKTSFKDSNLGSNIKCVKYKSIPVIK